MSKLLKPTEEQVNNLLEKIKDKLLDSVVLDGKIKLDYTFEDKDDFAIVSFTPEAYIKMCTLVAEFDSEVAWHGTVERDGNHFTITDILVYPQVVTGSTVNTDQEDYQIWLMDLEDDVFNKLRMQGHSHVNMSTSPSSVDTTHQESIVEKLGDDDYYIFIIWNKKHESTVRIYDMANNVLYEDEDILITIDDYILDEMFIRDANDNVVKKTYTYSNTKSVTTSDDIKAASKKSSKKEKKSKPITAWDYLPSVQYKPYDPYEY